MFIVVPKPFWRATELVVHITSALPVRRHVCSLAALTRTGESGIKIMALAPLFRCLQNYIFASHIHKSVTYYRCSAGNVKA